MTEDSMEIYRQRVLDHNREPHNLRRPHNADRQVTGFNPLCGDKLTVYMTVQQDKLVDVAFEGAGCAISVASASMMTDALLGLSLDDARALIYAAHAMFTDGDAPTADRLQETRALESVREYPSRVKCATLAWSAAEAAINEQVDQVSTE